MIVKALRVGGSGWVTENWTEWPWDQWGVPHEGLHKGSLNLVLELGCHFHVPNEQTPDEKQGRQHGTIYFLTPVRIMCVSKRVQNNSWFDGFIVRKVDEPSWLYHMVEVIAPTIDGLSNGLKEVFEVEGPFRRFGED